VAPLVPQRAPTDLAAVVGAAVTRMRADLDRAATPVSVHVDAAVDGEWDPVRLEQAVCNLLGNAVKYGAGGPIEITVGGDAIDGWVSIRDHGRGMDDQERTDLFHRFERRVPVDQFGGLGLGLWVVQRIAEAHGGHVDLWTHPGRGARFTLVLPRAQ